MDSRRIRFWIAGLLSLALLFGAAGRAEIVIGNLERPQGTETPADPEDILEGAIGGAGGQIVNPGAVSVERKPYTYQPLDVVLVLDTSGSMASITRGGQQVISLAQDAAVLFTETLFSLSTDSRVALVGFDSDVRRLADGYLDAGQEETLRRSIRATYASGQTNTPGAFAEAAALVAEAREDTRKVVLMLTDGIPVAGGDPIADTVDRGQKLGGTGALVYTVGLVGALGEGEKQTARSVLNAGYETRYFEVDNRTGAGRTHTDRGGYTYVSGEDVASDLADIFSGICLAALSRNDGYSNYSLWVDGNMEIRVADVPETGILSSDPLNFADRAAYGHLAIVGEDKEQKSVTLTAGEYYITLRGCTTGRGAYRLTRLHGYRMIPEILAEASTDTHPAQVLRFHITGDGCEVEDLSWDPLDHLATDPFSGQPTRGSETAAVGRMTQKGSLYGWTHTKAAKLLNLSKGGYVQVLARDPETGWLLAAAVNDKGRPVRGWIPRDSVKVSGYVPALIRDAARVLTVDGAGSAMGAPGDAAAEVLKLKGGEQVTTLHAERDTEGREWAYVLLKGKKDQAFYLPADRLEGWSSVSPDGFRIGYAMPALIWTETLGGKGYTEIMWVAGQKDGSGTVLSGRTSSTSGDIRAKYGNRDALALLLGTDGSIERSAVWGGTGDHDSFHCILPADDGYFVSGVTRSNNKDFKGIWDTATISGKTKDTTKMTNALIGRLGDDLSIRWMKSFGTNEGTFGFDMVVQTADGNIAGCGWMKKSSGFVISGYGMQDFLVMKLTGDGQLLSYNHYGSGQDDVPDSAVATPDGGLMLVGNRGLGGNNSEGQIYITDSGLSQIHQVSYGGSGADVFDNIRDLNDGTYLVTGFTDSFTGSMDYWAVQIDRDGRMIWSKTYGGSGREEVCGTTVLPDGRCVLLGYTTSTDGRVQGGTGSGKDAWAVCIDGTGRILWQYTASLPGDDCFNAAAIDPADGSLVLAGYCERKSDKNAKGYAVKLRMP